MSVLERPGDRRIGWKAVLLALGGALCVAAWGLGTGPAARAADEVDAIRAGKAVPVVEVLTAVRERFPDARVLKLELDQEWRPTGRIWVYEVKVLTPDGDVFEVEYDAHSLEVIDLKKPGQD